MGYGFNAPRKSRDFIRPEDPIYKAFESWLDFIDGSSFPKNRNEYDCEELNDLNDFYKDAEKIVSEIEGIEQRSPEEMHAIIPNYENHKRIRTAGIFLSACYNVMMETQIIYDVWMDTPLDFVGIFLSGRSLIIDSNAGDYVGAGNKGKISNMAVIGEEAAHKNLGIFVNFGEAKNGVIGRGNAGRVINCGKIEGNLASHSSGIAINFGDVSGDMAWRSAKHSINIALGGIHGGGICGEGWNFGGYMHELEGHKRLTVYLEKMRDRLEEYKRMPAKEHFGVFDFLKEEMGKRQKFGERVKDLSWWVDL